MKRSIVFVLIAIMLLMSLASCSKKDSTVPDGMSAAENEAVNFNFYYPELWQVSRNDGVVSVYASPTDSSSVSVIRDPLSVYVTSVDEYLELDEKNYFDRMRETFSDFTMVSDGEETTLGGAAAKQYVFTASVAGTVYKFRQVIAVRPGDEYVYVLTYTSTPELFDSHTDDVNSMIKEFSFK